jgi:hypothetical protein
MMPNWTRLPSGNGYSWRVWEGDAQESGWCSTSAQAMEEIRKASKRVGAIEVQPVLTAAERLEKARELLRDARAAIDDRTCISCINQALEHLDKALDDLNA